MLCLIALQKKIRSKLRFFFLNFVIIFQTPTWNALKYFHWNVYRFSPLSFEFALTLLGCLKSSNITITCMIQKQTKPVGHGAKSPALHQFKNSIWYILQLKNRQLREVSFPCLFRIPSQPFAYRSRFYPLFLSLFSSDVQLLREHWITGSMLCRLWVPDAEAHLTLCTCLTQQAILQGHWLS